MPLSALDLEKYFQVHNVPLPGRDLIRDRIATGPKRRTHGGRSVNARIASPKNGKTRQAESRTLEAPATRLCERAKNVLGFFDQPCLLKLAYVSPGSTRKTTDHYPDFLVIRDEEIALEEWKFEETLRELAISTPGKYVKDADGVWHNPWADKAAAELGFVYRVRTEAELPALLIRNSELIAPHAGVSVANPAAIIGYVRDVPGASIADVLEHVTGASINDVFALLALELIWVDLERALLTDHARVALFASEELGRRLQTPISLIPTGAVSFAPDTALLWNGMPWTVANAAPTKVTLEDASGRLKTLTREAALDLVRAGELRMAGPKVVDLAQLLANVPARALEVAYQRLEALRPYLENALVPHARTHRRWLGAAVAARTRYGRDAAVLGLVPKYGLARERKADAKAIAIAHAVIKELVFTKARRPYHTGYKIYAERCTAEKTRPVSMKTYRLEIGRLTHGGATLRRLGRKMANAQRGVRPISLFPVDGDRAFERVHIDHTLLDIELVDSVNGDRLGRPWLTLAIDAYTRRILGHVLMFDPPSAATVMLIMRDIVARYGRLPATFVVDNGSEFKSTYFQATVAAYDRSIEYRPPMDPRFGAVIESCFGKVNRDFIHALEGNTVGRKDVRSQDPKHDAALLAIWDLAYLEDLLATYFYEVYDRMRSQTAGLSPRERFEKSIAEAGVAETEAISDDEHFRVMTAPELSRTVVVSRQGIKAKGLRYSCDAFERPGVRGSKVRVRWEPYNRAVAYAFVEDAWHVCHAPYFALLVNRTERELRIASAELTARLKRAPSTRELARHLEKALQTEDALRARKKALEALRAGGALSAKTSSRAVAAPAQTTPIAINQDPPKPMKEWKKTA
ncbi:MAG: DDE-type integrase/transposase/recombinase [Actinomycetota bacterium]|nr:DDE-type integrase/transposase/recombinase [Actinomycetota bacterium]